MGPECGGHGGRVHALRDGFLPIDLVMVALTCALGVRRCGLTVGIAEPLLFRYVRRIFEGLVCRKFPARPQTVCYAMWYIRRGHPERHPR